MPKISNNSRRVNKEYYEVEVWYNQDHHFYAKIPKEFDEQYAEMSWQYEPHTKEGKKGVKRLKAFI